MPVDRTLSSTDRAAQERTLMDDYMRGTGQDPQVCLLYTSPSPRDS